jgi:hypothetical protein
MTGHGAELVVSADYMLRPWRSGCWKASMLNAVRGWRRVDVPMRENPGSRR